MNCQECNGLIINDDGREICSQCGLVVNDSVLVEQRSYIEEPIVAPSKLTLSSRLIRVNKFRNKPETLGFSLLSKIAGFLELPNPILQHAKYLYKKYSKNKHILNSCSFSALCLYNACKKFNFSINIHQIIQVYHDFSILSINRKLINRDIRYYQFPIQKCQTKISQSKTPSIESLIKLYLKKLENQFELDIDIKQVFAVCLKYSDFTHNVYISYRYRSSDLAGIIVYAGLRHHRINISLAKIIQLNNLSKSAMLFIFYKHLSHLFKKNTQSNFSNLVEA